MFNSDTWKEGERLTREHMKKHGYKILYTNYSCVGVELDIVALYPKKFQIHNLKQELKMKCKVSKSKEEMKTILTEMVSKMDTGENFVYWQVTRGTDTRNHVFPEKNIKANLWITISPKEIPDIYKKVKLITLEDTRFLHCNIKTLNLIPSVMASQKAKECGIIY